MAIIFPLSKEYKNSPVRFLRLRVVQAQEKAEQSDAVPLFPSFYYNNLTMRAAKAALSSTGRFSCNSAALYSARV